MAASEATKRVNTKKSPPPMAAAGLLSPYLVGSKKPIELPPSYADTKMEFLDEERAVIRHYQGNWYLDREKGGLKPEGLER